MAEQRHDMADREQKSAAPPPQRIQSPGLALVFSAEEIASARSSGRLLSLDVELTKRCNFRCIYCYAAPGARQERELAVDEVVSVIDQAAALGAKTVTLTGGEPLLHAEYFSIARYARQRGLSVLLFTNGSRITPSVAETLKELQVSPCVKVDSLSEKVQDRMAGAAGAYRMIQKGLTNLIEAGFASDYPVLSINATVCRENMMELPAIWSWARERGITPSLTRLQPMGRAEGRADLAVGPLELEALFKALADIDEEFGVCWEPLIPWHGGKACRRHYIGCFIDSTGNVQPCSGVPLKAGNVRESSLQDILSTSVIFRQARNIDAELDGACRTCRHNCDCYGCRSIAYFSGNGFTGTDTLCWHSGG